MTATTHESERFFLPLLRRFENVLLESLERQLGTRKTRLRSRIVSNDILELIANLDTTQVQEWIIELPSYSIFIIIQMFLSDDFL